MNYWDTVLQELCGNIQNDELRNYCFTGRPLRVAEELLSDELDKDVKELVNTFGWNIPDLDELEGCIELAISIDTQDEVKVAKALLRAAEKYLESGESETVSDAIFKALWDTRVDDVVTNIVAQRLSNAINLCREERNTKKNESLVYNF